MTNINFLLTIPIHIKQESYESWKEKFSDQQIFSASSVRKCMESDTRICMWTLQHTLISHLQLRSAQSTTLKGMYVMVDSPVFAASVPLQIMRRSWSTLMSCEWRPPLGTDTLVSLTGTPITVLRVARCWEIFHSGMKKRKKKCWILLLKRFFYISYMHNFRPNSKAELFMYPT